MKETIFTGVKNINGNDIYYEFNEQNPSKETVLLIHGFLSSSFSFRRLIPLLKDEYNVISVDFPPFGKSGKSPKFVYSYENIASSLIQLAQILNIERLAVIGHSMGGQISLRMAHLQPSIVNKAILLCSSSYLKRSKLPLIYTSYIPFFHHYVKYHLSRSGVLHNLKNVVYDHSLIDDEMLQGYTSPFLQADIFKGLTKMIRDREEELNERELNEIETPSLLIWGEHDRVVPLHVGKRLANDLKHSELVVLPKTGHLVPEEKPIEVFQHIKDFLEK